MQHFHEALKKQIKFDIPIDRTKITCLYTSTPPDVSNKEWEFHLHRVIKLHEDDDVTFSRITEAFNALPFESQAFCVFWPDEEDFVLYLPASKKN